jgi:hypothetical protein
MLSDARISIPAHVLTRRLDDELVLLNLDNDFYFGLDEVGTRMWEVLALAPSIDVAIDQLVAEYDTEPQRVRNDVEKLVAELVDNGLVELNRD